MQKTFKQPCLKSTPSRFSSERSFNLEANMVEEYILAIEDLIYHDDIMIAKEIIKEVKNVAPIGVYEKLFSLSSECDKRILFSRNQKPDNYAERGNHFDPRKIQRFVLAEKAISNYVERNPKAESFLDLGCNQGDFSFLIASKFPALKVLGVDYSISCVKEATDAFVSQVPEGKLSFLKCSAEEVEGKYDIVFAGELMEHVESAQEFIKKLESLCNTNGLIVITTPSGPWEAISVRTQSEFRSHHLHHFEEEDLKELFGKKKEVSLAFSGAGCSDLGEPLGNWITSYINTEQNNTGRIDIGRKLKDTIF